MPSTSLQTLEHIRLSTFSDGHNDSGATQDLTTPEGALPTLARLRSNEAALAGAPSVSAPSVADDIPDGGYGWVVVAACSVLASVPSPPPLTAHLTNSARAGSSGAASPIRGGIIQAHLTASHLGTDAQLSFVGSTALTFTGCTAVVNTRVIRWLGTQRSALLGCFLLGTGQLLNSWTVGSVGGLVVTNGVVTGLGVSMLFMACGSLPSQYFKRRRGLANGFVFSGVGIGGAVVSVGMDGLIDRVGIPWSFRILGIVTLAVGLPTSLLLKERSRRAVASVEWGLFRDPKFLVLFLGTGIGTFPLLVPPFFIPLYAQSVGASNTLASVMLAVFNLASACGRIGFGMLGDKVGPISSLALSLVVTSVSVLVIWPVSDSVAPLVVFIIMSGISSGGFFSTMPSVVGHVYGPTRLANALAMVVTGWAVGYLLGSPIAGWILEAYGGSSAGRAAFRPAIYYAGTLSVVSASLVVTMRQLLVKKVIAFA